MKITLLIMVMEPIPEFNCILTKLKVQFHGNSVIIVSVFPDRLIHFCVVNNIDLTATIYLICKGEVVACRLVLW